MLVGCVGTDVELVLLFLCWCGVGGVLVWCCVGGVMVWCCVGGVMVLVLVLGVVLRWTLTRYCIASSKLHVVRIA